MQDEATINFLPVYDQILQETFTDSETGKNGRTSPRSRWLNSPVYECLNRPPHITLFWTQSLDGQLLINQKSTAISGLLKKLEEVHEATLLNNIGKSIEGKDSGKRVLINPTNESQGDIIYTTQAGIKYNGEHVHLLQEQDGLLPQVLRHLVREHRIKTLLLEPDNTDTLTAYLNSQQVDKVVVVLKPEISSEDGASGNSGMKRMPMRLVNTHYEILDGLNGDYRRASVQQLVFYIK